MSKIQVDASMVVTGDMNVNSVANFKENVNVSKSLTVDGSLSASGSVNLSDKIRTTDDEIILDGTVAITNCSKINLTSDSTNNARIDFNDTYGNDHARLMTKNSSSYGDSLEFEIATADGGTEPIVVRQYEHNGENTTPDFKWTVVRHQLTLLDANGDTQITGTLHLTNDNENQITLKGAVNDIGRIRMYANNGTSNDGVFEIATCDDAAEPIVVRQYHGTWNTLQRELKLLDGVGNTYVPGTLYVKDQDILTDINNLKALL